MAAKKKSASDTDAAEPRDFGGFYAKEPPETPAPLAASLAESIGIAGMVPEPQPVIRSLQLHRRASITGIRGTADLLTVGEVIESIEAQMLGPVAGFVLVAKKAKPIFLPAASVLAVTVE
jgi:hypothetical protein